jgi:UDP-glucuronate decarboxylase
MKIMKHKRAILITGGAGNVGGSLAARLVADPDNYVVVVDDLTTGDRAKLPVSKTDNFRFVKLDVNEYQGLSALMTNVNFDYVFHYAAVVGVERTLAKPLLVLADIDGIRNILALSKNTGVKRVFYSSSSEVYGEPFEIPQNEETTPLNSRLPYAIVKNMGESYFKSYHREFGLEYTIFRFFNTYGPNQSEDFVLPKFLRNAVEGTPITIYGDGTQTRTFCYIDDNVDTTIRCLYDDCCINDTLNVGSDQEMSILELAQVVIDRTGSKSVIDRLPALTEGDMSRRCPDNSRMRKILDRPLLSLNDGLSKMLESFSATL